MNAVYLELLPDIGTKVVRVLIQTHSDRPRMDAVVDCIMFFSKMPIIEAVTLIVSVFGKTEVLSMGPIQ